MQFKEISHLSWLIRPRICTSLELKELLAKFKMENFSCVLVEDTCHLKNFTLSTLIKSELNLQESLKVKAHQMKVKRKRRRRKRRERKRRKVQKTVTAK